MIKIIRLKGLEKRLNEVMEVVLDNSIIRGKLLSTDDDKIFYLSINQGVFYVLENYDRVRFEIKDKSEYITKLYD